MRKNSPVENAMNASAMSGRNAMPSMTRRGIKSMQNGPIKMPVTMYAVTLGSLSSLVTRVVRNARIIISESEMMTTATGAESFSCAYSVSSIVSPSCVKM